MSKTSKIIDRMVAPTVDIEALLRAGGALSNCAYNLSQLERVPERDREVLAACCKDWDEVCNGLSMLRAALKSAQPQAEQQGEVDVEVIEAARAAYREVKVYSTGETRSGEVLRSVADLNRNDDAAWRAAITAALAARQPVGESTLR